MKFKVGDHVLVKASVISFYQFNQINHSEYVKAVIYEYDKRYRCMIEELKEFELVHGLVGPGLYYVDELDIIPDPNYTKKQKLQGLKHAK